MTDVERMRDALQEMVDAFDYIPLTGDFERRRAARAKAQTALHSPERSAARSEGELERLLRSDDGQPVRIHPDGSISPIDAAEFDANVERLKPCEHCRSEGRIIRVVSRHWGLEPKEEDCGECPVCEGDGMELIEVESIDLDDLCRNGGCQYGMAPEYTCRHECQYKRANSKQETVSDGRDGAAAERSAAQPTCCECGRTPVVGLDPPLCIHCYGRDALRKLADAADDVGVKFFDTDTMDPLVEKMQAATQAARCALKGGK
jgi:hypothetical protein